HASPMKKLCPISLHKVQLAEDFPSYNPPNFYTYFFVCRQLNPIPMLCYASLSVCPNPTPQKNHCQHTKVATFLCPDCRCDPNPSLPVDSCCSGPGLHETNPTAPECIKSLSKK